MKRTVSVLLVTALCVCLFSVFTVSAFAEQHLDGTVGVQYSNMYEEDLGFTATSIALNDGAPPAGITVNISGSRLYISGTPTATGSFNANYRVYSDAENYRMKYFSFTISAPVISVSGTASGTNVNLTGNTNSGSVMFFYRDSNCLNPGNPSSISGGNASYTDSGLTPGQSYSYKAGVNIGGALYYSPDVTVTVPASSQPKAELSSADNKLVLNVSGVDASAGYTVFFVANTQNSTSGGFQLNGTGITANSASYTYQPDFTMLPESSYYFYAIVKAGNSNLKSNTVQLGKPEEAKVKVTKSPTGETVDEGDSAMFISAAENYTKLEWRIITSDGSSCWRNKNEIESKFPGVEYNAYKGKDNREVLVLSHIPATMDGYYIETKFWGKDDNDTQFTETHSAKLTVKTTGPQVPSISSQPKDITAETGDKVSLSVTASASQGTVKYQWYMNTVKSTSGAAKIDSATSSSFTPPQNQGTYYYFCAVWTEKGSETSSVSYSDIAQVVYTAPAVEESPEIVVTPEPTVSPEVSAGEDEPEEQNNDHEAKDKKAGDSSSAIFVIIALLGAGLAGGVAALVAKRNSSAKSAEASIKPSAEPKPKFTADEVSKTKMPVKMSCEYCGWEPESQDKLPKFCPDCGKPFAVNKTEN